MFSPEPPRLVRLRLAIAAARRDLAHADARWGSLSLEYVEARERRDALTAVLRDAQLGRLATYVRLVWARVCALSAAGLTPTRSSRAA
jgi:hypothetical protein